MEHRSWKATDVIRAGARWTLALPQEKITKVHSVAYVQHQRFSKRVLFEDDVAQEAYMPPGTNWSPSPPAFRIGSTHGIRRSRLYIGSRVMSATDGHTP